MPEKAVQRPQSDSERLIAITRAVLAVSALIAIRIDPIEPADPAIMLLVGFYSAYAIALALWAWRSASYDERLPAVTHAIDLALFSTINFLMFSSGSVFFVFFVFALLCAMLRFGRRGTLFTAAVAIAVFLASVLVADVSGGVVEMNRFIIRVVYLGVVGGLLVHLAGNQERVRTKLPAFATWPRSRWTGGGALVGQTLEQLAAVSPRTVVALDDPEGRKAYLGQITAGTFMSEELPVDAAEEILQSAELALVTRTGSGGVISFTGQGGDLVRTERQPLPHSLLERFSAQAILAVPFERDFVRGLILFLDPDETLKDGAIARVVADIAGSRLEHYWAVQQLRRGAAAEERIRVARDLHDSLLQSLTGAALQLQTLPRVMQRSPAEAADRIAEVQQGIAADQRELRWFIDSLQGNEPEAGSAILYDIEERLSSLTTRFLRHSNMEVDIRVDRTLRLTAPSVQLEVYSIVSEAVANAAKHAEARRVTVDVRREHSGIAITVEDDGKGFPFHGTFSLAELLATARGPVTLKERVASLQGEMAIVSSPSGSRIDVRVPVSV